MVEYLGRYEAAFADAQIPPNGPQYDCRGACAVSVYDKMFKTAAGNAITACLGTVPGYWFTVAFVDTIGCIFIRFMGVRSLALACPYFQPAPKSTSLLSSGRGAQLAAFSFLRLA